MKPHWLLGLLALPVGFAVRKWRNDPQFGASARDIARWRPRESTATYKLHQYRNLQRTPLQEDLGSLMGDLLGYIQAKNTQPAAPLPVAQANDTPFLDPGDDAVTWYGHSALRLETGGKTILLDPMLGEWVAPVPFLGHRFPYADFEPLRHIGQIDLVVYSHDHYDHLDYDTVLAIRERTRHWLVPLGVGAHLEAWGIPPERITQLDWWESTDLSEIAGATFTATPARHFSGRSPSTRNKTLWCGYAIRTANNHIYFGGDSGYGTHFAEIGRRLGPFDLTMLDSGQYHDRWRNVHMQPEEALLAHRDLGGKTLLPIHWGGFSLSDHSWFDPVDRILRADGDDCVVSPMIGERFTVGEADSCRDRWWEPTTPAPSASAPSR